MNQTAIHIEQLTVAYQAVPVLWQVGLNVQKGKRTAIIGPNGAGKSTLIKSILGLMTPLTGEVGFSVKDGEWAEYKSIKKSVAYVPQKSSVDWDFPTTVLDVVVMGRYGHLGWFKRPGKKDTALAEEMLVKVGMHSFKDRQISQLSGGQRQRVFLARALVQQAEIYLLDEPLAGVDMKSEKVIMELLEELSSVGKTVIVVHHDLQTVKEYFDEVVFLNREVVAAGSVATTFTEDVIEETYRKDHSVAERVDQL